MFSGIAAATVAFVSGPGGLVLDAFMVGAWTTLFTNVAGDVVKMGEDAVGGYWWRDLVESYMHKQAQILTAAMDEIEQLGRRIGDLITLFNTDEDIQAFLKDYAT